MCNLRSFPSRGQDSHEQTHPPCSVFFLSILCSQSVAAAAQPRGPKPPSSHTTTSADGVAAWTAAEKKSFYGQIRDFPGLQKLARHNAAMIEELWQLLPRCGDSSFPGAQVGGNSLISQDSLKELENLMRMAEVLQEVAVSLAVNLQFNSTSSTCRESPS